MMNPSLSKFVLKVMNTNYGIALRFMMNMVAVTDQMYSADMESIFQNGGAKNVSKNNKTIR